MEVALHFDDMIVLSMAVVTALIWWRSATVRPLRYWAALLYGLLALELLPSGPVHVSPCSVVFENWSGNPSLDQSSCNSILDH